MANPELPGADDGVKVKIRKTTRADTWTVPADDDRRVDFFHKEEWDELHIVHQDTGVCIAIYSRAQVVAMCSRVGKKTRKSRSGTMVQILQVK